MKKLNIFFLFFISCILLSSSVLSTDFDIIGLYEFDSNTSNIFRDDNHLTLGATAQICNTQTIVGNGSLCLDNGATDYAQIVDTAINMSSIRTINYWVYFSSNDCGGNGDDMEMTFGDGGAGYMRNYVTQHVYNGGWTLNDGGDSAGAWKMRTIVFGGGSQAESWLNKDLFHNDTETNDFTGWDTITIGNWYTPNSAYAICGYIDNVVLSGTRWSEAMIDEAYNGGSGYDFSIGGGTPSFPDPTITETYEANVQEQDTTNISILFRDFNATIDSVAYLTYNNTIYTPTKTYTNHSYLEFNYLIDIPYIRFNNTLNNFTWNYSINNTGVYTQTDINTQILNWEDNKSLIFINARDGQTWEKINSFYVNVTNDDYGAYTYAITDNGTIAQKNSGNKTLIIWSDNHAYNTYDYNFTDPSNNLLVDLFEVTALRIQVFKEGDGTELDGCSITILNLDSDETTEGDCTLNEYYTTLNQTGNLSITVSNSSFSDRTYYEQMNAGRYVLLSTYLLDSADAQSTSFTVYNEFNQLVSDAQLSFYRSVNNSLVKVAQKLTDFSGVAVVDLYATGVYVMRVTHDSYLQKEVNLIPSSTSYIVRLVSNTQYTNLFDGIEYNFVPTRNSNLEGDTDYDFIFSISDANNNLDYWGVNLTLPNGTVLSSTGIDSTGGIATISFTTPVNYSELNAVYFLETGDGDEWAKNTPFYVYPNVTGNYTLLKGFTDHTDDFTDLEKALIVTFICLGIVGGTSIFVGFNPILIDIEILLILGIAGVLGWLPLWIILLMSVPTIFIYLLGRGRD